MIESHEVFFLYSVSVYRRFMCILDASKDGNVSVYIEIISIVYTKVQNILAFSNLR